MTVKYSRYVQMPYATIGTALSASGTVVAPTSNGDRILLDSMQAWLQVPSGTVTVTLSLGGAALPPIALTSERANFDVPSFTLDQNTGITATLSGAGTVGFFGRYVIATDN